MADGIKREAVTGIVLGLRNLFRAKRSGDNDSAGLALERLKLDFEAQKLKQQEQLIRQSQKAFEERQSAAEELARLRQQIQQTQKVPDKVAEFQAMTQFVAPRQFSEDPNAPASAIDKSARRIAFGQESLAPENRRTPLETVMALSLAGTPTDAQSRILSMQGVPQELSAEERIIRNAPPEIQELLRLGVLLPESVTKAYAEQQGFIQREAPQIDPKIVDTDSGVFMLKSDGSYERIGEPGQKDAFTVSHDSLGNVVVLDKRTGTTRIVEGTEKRPATGTTGGSGDKLSVSERQMRIDAVLGTLPDLIVDLGGKTGPDFNPLRPFFNENDKDETRDMARQVVADAQSQGIPLDQVYGSMLTIEIGNNTVGQVLNRDPAFADEIRRMFLSPRTSQLEDDDVDIFDGAQTAPDLSVPEPTTQQRPTGQRPTAAPAGSRPAATGRSPAQQTQAQPQGAQAATPAAVSASQPGQTAYPPIRQKTLAEVKQLYDEALAEPDSYNRSRKLNQLYITQQFLGILKDNPNITIEDAADQLSGEWIKKSFEVTELDVPRDAPLNSVPIHTLADMIWAAGMAVSRNRRQMQSDRQTRMARSQGFAEQGDEFRKMSENNALNVAVGSAMGGTQAMNIAKQADAEVQRVAQTILSRVAEGEIDVQELVKELRGEESNLSPAIKRVLRDGRVKRAIIETLKKRNQ